MNRLKEEQAIVLDVLPNGYPDDTRPSHMKTPIAQALGNDRFTLLELVPKKEVQLQPGQDVYIGEGKRDQIHHIIGRMPMKRLTATARSELKFAVQDIVKKKEKYFVEFFNKAQALTTRMHQLELLPGLGKKHMWQIIDERSNEYFKSFDDLKKRVRLMPDPETTVIKRILKELSGKEKHRVFVD